MELKAIKIINYKSFREDNNLILIDDINTIVGKNESGKSNLIDAISKINILGIRDNNFFKSINKNAKDEEKIVISLVLSFNFKEKNDYNIEKDTVITFNNQYDIAIDGGLSDAISNNQIFQDERNKINEFPTPYFTNEAEKNQFKNIIDNIKNAENKVFINYTYVNTILNKLEKNEKYVELWESMTTCITYLNELYSRFPKFIFIENIELDTKYTKDYLMDKTKNKRMLEYLLQAIGLSLDDLNMYWKLAKDDDKYNFVDEINGKIEKIIEKFNEFYKQEKVTLKLNFENSAINFIVKTGNKYLDLSERSNGLKWYLNMYIQMLAKTKEYIMKNYILLLDEPGVYLHINAQKEILNLFEDFTNKNNKIIYTTHLPSMIYQDKLYRIRTVVKDENGNSNISNKYYTLPHKMESKKETITPIITAIGMNMGYSFENPDINTINIITEGISDYNYLKAYLHQVEYKENYNIIPSSGVSNIHNLVSILIGWGYKYKILMDQDGDGRKQYRVLTQKLVVNIDDIKFVDGTNKENKKITKTIEDLFSEEDKSYIGINNQDYSKEKAYYSLEILKKVENDEYEFNEETLANFDKIITEWLDKKRL